MYTEEKLKDIRCFINEQYDGLLSFSQLMSRRCFNEYCEDIEKDLKVLEILKNKQPSIFLIRESKSFYGYLDSEYGRYWVVDDEYILKEWEYNLIKDWLKRK